MADQGVPWPFDKPFDPAMMHVCEGCASAGRCFLGVTGALHPDGTVTGHVTMGPEHAGGPGIAHGGFVAAVLDEICAHVAVGQGRLVVTQTLEITYRRPVPVGRRLEARAWLDGIVGRTWEIRGELRKGETLFASAFGRFVEPRPDHFQRIDRAAGRGGPP